MADCLRLKKSRCENCYKCIRHCPVKSIRFSGSQAHIIPQECVLCGQCFVVCPQNAKEIADDTERAKVLLSGGERVIASIAPSFAANYEGVGIAAMEKALKQLGFFAVEETAIGATMVKNAYDDILKDGKRSNLISSCCHTVNLLIQKYYPSALKYLADIISPMQAHCQDIKRRFPGAKTVFIGPCISKKDEAQRYEGIVDCVLTFEELTKWLNSRGIALEKDRDANEKSRARFFPTAGGILKTMRCDQPRYTYLAVDGMENCIAALKDIESGRVQNCFIEMSACTGSCIGGPVMEKRSVSPIYSYQQVAAYAGKEDFLVPDLSPGALKLDHLYLETGKQMPGQAEVSAILRQMGKTKPEHELNCGSCGYNTCREKAYAVYQGKAEIGMCLPFIKAKSENFSNIIINNTPNGIIVLNEKLEVQQINGAAQQLLHIRTAQDVLGDQVVRILDPKPFLDVLRFGRNLYNQRSYLAEYGLYADQTVLHDKEYHILILILRDVTQEESARAQKEEMSRQTVAVVDKVVEKQMRVVQEIASLLGETTAETKIALTKLKETIRHE